MAKINCKTWRDASNDLEGYLSSSWITADDHKLSNNKCVGGRICDGAVVCGASVTACARIISFLGETFLSVPSKSETNLIKVVTNKVLLLEAEIKQNFPVIVRMQIQIALVNSAFLLA